MWQRSAARPPVISPYETRLREILRDRRARARARRIGTIIGVALRWGLFVAIGFGVGFAGSQLQNWLLR